MEVLANFFIWIFAAFAVAGSDIVHQQRFRVIPSDVVAKEGENVTLRCEIDHLEGRVQWTKDGFALGYTYPNIRGYPRYQMLVNQQNGVYNLHIEQASLEDDAEFQCQVGPTLQPTVQKAIRAGAKVTVITAPKHVSLVGHINGSIIGVKENQSLKLECLVRKSKPPADVIWYRGSSELQKFESREDKVIDCERRNFTNGNVATAAECDFSSKITFTPTLSDDNVTYSCSPKHQAISPNRYLTTSVRLIVLYPPTFPYIEGYEEGRWLHDGQEVELICKSRGGNPAPQLSWHKNGETVQTLYRTVGKVSESRYTFHVDGSDNRAKYACLASTPALETPYKVDVKLNVYFGPSSVTIFGDSEGKSGKTVTLTCATSSSYPASVVKWFVDGQLLHNATTRESAGLYGGFITTSELTFVVPPNKKELLVLCYGMNQQLSKSVIANTTVGILYPPGQPIINGYVKGGYISAGSVYKMTCISSGGNPLAMLNWYKNDRKIHSVVKKSDGSSSSAEISISVNSTDNGAIYKCEATNPATAEPLDAAVRLNVYFPPTNVSVRVEPRELRVGTLARLTCECSSSNPEAELSWWHNGIPITDGIFKNSKPGLYGGNVSYSELTINVSSYMDGSAFICQAQNTVLQTGVNTAQLLSVMYKPVFAELNQTVFIGTENEPFSVSLKATANPSKIFYKWTKDRVSISKGVYGPVLNITRLTRSDAGVYTCEARNPEGFDMVSFRVSVKHSASILEVPETVMVSDGVDAKMYCIVDGNPITVYHVKWMNPEIQNLDRRASYEFNLENNTSWITVHNVTKKDTGHYYCTVNNGIGTEANRSVYLIVEHEPYVNPVTHITKVASRIGDSVKFTCTGSGAPKLLFTWFKGPDIIINNTAKYSIVYKQVDALQYKSALVIHNVQSTDYGNYSCIARNKHGYSNVDYILTVTSKPDVPVNLTLLNVTYNAAVLKWNLRFDGGEQTSFRLRYRGFGSEQENYRYEDVGGSTVHKVHGLEPGVTYMFDVMAFNKHGNSDWSRDTVNVTVPGEIKNPLATFVERENVVLVVAAVVVVVLILLNVCLATAFLFRRLRKEKDRISESSNDSTSKLHTADGYGSHNGTMSRDTGATSLSQKSVEFATIDRNYMNSSGYVSSIYPEPNTVGLYEDRDVYLLETSEVDYHNQSDEHPGYRRQGYTSLNRPNTRANSLHFPSSSALHFVTSGTRSLDRRQWFPPDDAGYVDEELPLPPPPMPMFDYNSVQERYIMMV